MIVPTKKWLRKKSITGIYRITSPSGRVYVGQSWDIISRWRMHKYSYTSVRGCNFLSKSILKYGIENHVFEIIHQLPCDVTQEVLNNYEVLYIKQYKDAGVKMMNLNDGGGSAKPSKETIEKRRQSMKGKKTGFKKGNKPWNVGTVGLTQAWNKGLKGVYVASEETRKKISVANKGKQNSLGTKRPLHAIIATANKNRGAKRSEEMKTKMRENHVVANNIGSWNKGKIRTEENKRKISETLKNRTDNKGDDHNMSKLSTQQVLEIRTKYSPRIYSLNMVAKEYGISKRNVLDIVKRKIWKHV